MTVANLPRIGALRMVAASSTSSEVHLQRVRDFIEEWSRPAMKARRCLYFALLKDTEDGATPINTNEIGKDVAEDARPQRCAELAQKFMEDATLSVDMGSGRAQLFSVAAYTSLAPDSAPLSMIPFKLASSQEVTLGLGESESPTTQGALGLSMRWNENLNRSLVTVVDRVMDRSERMLDSVLARLEKSEERNIALADQRERLMDNHLNRQIMATKAKLSIEREDRWLRAAEVYLMGIANRLMPEANPMNHPLMSWFTQNQGLVMGFLSQLPEDKRAEILSIFKNADAASGAAAAKLEAPQKG